jgi:hypothetical protein
MGEILEAVVINDNEKAPIIVVPQASEYGIEETKAREIAAVFTPMLDQLKAYEVEYNKIMMQEPSKENAKEARALRMVMVKSRTSMAKEHKSLKDFYIKGGQFVDGMKKAYEFGTHSLEEKLEDREKHFENLEKERKENIRLTRLADIKEFEGTEPIGLAEMEQEQFDTYMIGVKATHAARKEAEERAVKEQEEKLAKLQLSQARGAEIRILASYMHEDEIEIKLGDLTTEEFDILKKTLEERKAERVKELEEARTKAKEAEEKAKKEKDEAEALMKKQQVEAAAEREKIEAKAKKDNEDAAAKLKAEREAMEKEREAARIEQEKADEENKKLQAEIAQKAKKEAEAIEAEKQRQELGDIPKFKAMRDELLLVIAKYSFTSEKAKSAQEAMRVSLLPKAK